MEFERSLFRVHKRSISICYNYHQNPGRVRVMPVCMRCTELCCMLTALALTVIVAIAHSTYVGSAGCMPPAVAAATAEHNVSITAGDVVYEIAVVASDTDPSVVGRYSLVSVPALAFLPDTLLRAHKFPVVNTTVPLTCGTFKGLSPGFATWLGVDTIIVNNALATFNSAGYITNLATAEAFSWGAPTDASVVWLATERLGALFLALISFVYNSSVTALLVRTLLAAGVIVFYPVLLCLRATGALNVSENVVLHSYPWLGLHIASLRAQRKSVVPFLLSQICQLFLLYSMYEASQVTLGFTFYAKSMPQGMQIAVYMWVLAGEYFAMVMLRSAANIRFYPRFFLMMYIMFHLYYYGNFYGFYLWAVGACGVYTVAAMLYMLRTAEVRALRTGAVASDRPRVFLNAMPWASSPADLPPLWTLFFPLNVRTMAVQDAPVPPAPAGIRIDLDDGGDGAGAGAGPGAGAGAGSAAVDNAVPLLSQADDVVARADSGRSHGAPANAAPAAGGAQGNGAVAVDVPLES